MLKTQEKHFTIPENIITEITGQNIATEEEIQEYMSRANNGDLKAQISLYDITRNYNRALIEQNKDESNKIKQEVKEQYQEQIRTKIAEQDLIYYNDEIKAGYFDENYQGVFKNFIASLAHGIEEKVQEELMNMTSDKIYTSPVIQEIEEKQRKTNSVLSAMYAQLSEQQKLLLPDLDIEVEEKGFVTSMRMEEEFRFPSFNDKFNVPYNSLNETLHKYSYENQDMDEKFNLLANMRLPENTITPLNKDLAITNIRDIQGDFDQTGNLHITHMTIEQRNRNTLISQTELKQAVELDFETGNATVTGEQKTKEDFKHYKYIVPITEIDSRIMTAQERIEEHKKALNDDSISFADKLFHGRQITTLQQNINTLTAIFSKENKAKNNQIEH